MAETPEVVLGLVERLGFERDSRLLIVNCDDLGVSHSANIATYRAMTDGVATSASLMVPCPWAREAAEMFAGLSVGVHLTLTSEYPAYRWRGLTNGKSLHDADGFLVQTTATAIAQVEIDEVYEECQAQIETALAWGIDVTHLDAHMDVLHSRSDLYECYLTLASSFGVPVRAPSVEANQALGINGREHANSRGIETPDRLIYPWPARTKDVVLAEAVRMPAGVSEIFLHPVQDGEELRAYDCVFQRIRAHDAECLVDDEVRRVLECNGIKRVSYRDLRDLQRLRQVGPDLAGPCVPLSRRER